MKLTEKPRACGMRTEFIRNNRERLTIFVRVTALATGPVRSLL